VIRPERIRDKLLLPPAPPLTNPKRTTLEPDGQGPILLHNGLEGDTRPVWPSGRFGHAFAARHSRPATSPCSRVARQFEDERVFWRQFEVARAIVAANDAGVLPRLEPWLTHEDRHLRGNAAFIFAGLGDPRGFEVVVAILDDRSETRAIQEISSIGLPSVRAQIRQDRYYAAHLLGNLKDPRGVAILVPLLKDPEGRRHCSLVSWANWR